MRVLVLAAGEGRRLRPLTLDRPKPMLTVGERPLLEQIVLLLKEHGITEIAINLHYKPKAIISHLGNGSRFGVRIQYSFERRLLGSAGAARRLDWFLGEGTFVVFYGDLYTDLNLSRLVAAHRRGDGWITMALYEVDNPTACGIVKLDGHGRVVRFVEKPRPEQVFSRLANAGVLVVEPQVLELIPPERPYDFGHDLFPQMLAADLPIYGYRVDGLLIDIGTPENYRRAQAIAARREHAVAR